MKDDNTYANDHIDLALLINYVEDSVAEDTRQSIDRYLKENEEERLVIEGIRTYYHQYGMDRESMLAYLQTTKDTALTAFKEQTSHKETSQTSSKKSIPLWIGWAAASLVFCLSVVAYLIIGGSNTAQSSFTSYLSDPYPVTVFLSGQNADAWIEVYQSGDYHRSAALLDQLVQEPHDNLTMLKYYAGLSHLYQQPPQLQSAITYLLQVNEGPFAQQAHWYLALAYLINKQVDEAQPLLEDIVNNQTYHYEEAADLLKRISKDGS